MPATLKLDVPGMKSLLDQCSNAERVEIARYLDRLTLGQRLRRFHSKMRSGAPALSDLTREMERVRAGRQR
jgi:hypothetical protein